MFPLYAGQLSREHLDEQPGRNYTVEINELFFEANASLVGGLTKKFTPADGATPSIRAGKLAPK